MMIKRIEYRNVQDAKIQSKVAISKKITKKMLIIILRSTLWMNQRILSTNCKIFPLIMDDYEFQMFLLKIANFSSFLFFFA